MDKCGQGGLAGRVLYPERDLRMGRVQFTHVMTEVRTTA